MYSTCLFCNGSLGTNESIEHFPVGRRIAFDAATGRLWVVCQKCERWNLSPLETRWEAIEEAERLFRATKTRVATDNIGLAKRSDGTELIRIGRPPEMELAVWRYGDQFRARYRRFLLQSGAVAAAFAIPTAVLSNFGFSGLQTPFMIGAGVTSAGSVIQGFVTRRYDRWRHQALPIASVRDAENNLLRFTQDNINAASLTHGDNARWTLALPHVSLKRAGQLAQFIGGSQQTGAVHEPATLHDAKALQALTAVLPSVNRFGTNNSGIKAAMQVIEESRSVDDLLKRASGESLHRAHRFAPVSREHQIAYAPAEVRLALEMSLHADDERRAMEGELTDLEQRWRDADAIAKIADDLLLPGDLQTRVDSLRDGM